MQKKERPVSRTDPVPRNGPPTRRRPPPPGVGPTRRTTAGRNSDLNPRPCSPMARQPWPTAARRHHNRPRTVGPSGQAGSAVTTWPTAPRPAGVGKAYAEKADRLSSGGPQGGPPSQESGGVPAPGGCPRLSRRSASPRSGIPDIRPGSGLPSSGIPTTCERSVRAHFEYSPRLRQRQIRRRNSEKFFRSNMQRWARGRRGEAFLYPHVSASQKDVTGAIVPAGPGRGATCMAPSWGDTQISLSLK